MDHTFSTGSNALQRCAVFFDLDRTLIGEISGNALVRMAWKTDQISLADILNAVRLFIAYKLKVRDPLLIINEMVGWVKGKSEKGMKELCAKTYHELLEPSIFNEGKVEIEIHRNNGMPVILLSSSLDYICISVSDYLGMDGFISSSLEISDGCLTGKPSGRLCFGEEKLNRLTGYCIANNIDLSCSWYYSDSISDLSVLEAVGHPVCVNPDSELRKLAGRRGWKICRWSN
jgi:HAD superfamily hydrolase (TIGR01490 family)